jgi:hypothetical protein
MPPPNFRRPTDDGTPITSGVQVTPLPNFRSLCYNSVTIISAVEEITVPNSRRLGDDGIIITSGVQITPLPDFRRLSHVSVTITSTVDRMMLK